MERILLAMLIGIATWNTPLFCQILAYQVKVDTSLYENTGMYGFYFFPGPGIEDIDCHTDPNAGVYMPHPGMVLDAFQRKNSNKYDIYSFTGKIGSGTLPDSIIGVDGGNIRCYLSKNFINDDPEWECLANYSNNLATGERYFFKVLDANGNVLLSDTGRAEYGFDGQNTYVCSRNSGYPIPMYRAWRFRTNISSGLNGNLAKISGTIPKIMTTYGPHGDYRIRLSPSGGGKTLLTLIDMLGRCIFSKDIGNITAPMTITVPENGIPPSPFVAKVKDKNGTVLRKETQVH